MLFLKLVRLYKHIIRKMVTTKHDECLVVFLKKYKKSIDNHLEMRYDIFCQQVKFASRRRIPR